MSTTRSSFGYMIKKSFRHSWIIWIINTIHIIAKTISRFIKQLPDNPLSLIWNSSVRPNTNAHVILDHAIPNRVISTTVYKSCRKYSVSSSRDVVEGVPQGSLLSPTLFLVYINDIWHYNKNELALIADDMTVITTIRKFMKSQTENFTNKHISGRCCTNYSWTQKSFLKFMNLV